jgi:hypothetical protein
VGTWHLPNREPQHALRVVAQCKALKTKLGPNLVRELEGAFRNPPIGWRTGEDNKLALLVSPREATKGVRDALTRSAYPLLWMMIDREGKLHQALWNGKAETLGLAPLGVEVRIAAPSSHEASVTSPQPMAESTTTSAFSAVTAKPQRSIALTWEGQEFPEMNSVEAILSAKEHAWLLRLGFVGLSGSEKQDLLDLVEASFPDLAYESQIGITGVSHFEKRRSELLAVFERKRESSTQP